jgi:HlyD family secretion protein
MKRRTWIFLGLGLVALAGAGYYLLARPKDEIKWRSVKLEKGNLTQRISATGAVAPMVQVAVGTQVSGVISALYADYNSIVKKGQVIAQIDPTIWETQLRDAEATLDRAKANLDDARRQFERAKRLSAEKLLSEQDLDAKEVAFKTTQASHENAKAALERAKANLAYCNITAPVDGVVISRLADVGQTVAASFSTPNLFQIAQDLSKMKVEISIDEADIDEVKTGQRAFFTVDSLPEKQFLATVSQVRLEPITTQNVVTYKVVIEVPNEPLASSEGQQAAAMPDHGSRRGNPDAAPNPGRPAAGAEGGERPQDPEKAWERFKDRLPAGTTKEEFVKRFKERMAQRQGAAPAPAARKTPTGAIDRAAAARTPGGAALLGGPVFGGNLALRPGMTANVTIVTNQRRDVLRVPNAALRFNPAAFQKDEKKAEAPRAGGLGAPPMMGMPARPQGGGQGGGGAAAKGMVSRRVDRFWTLDKGKPKEVIVKAGITDGQFTEITGENLQEGMVILVGVEDPNKKAAAAGPTPLGGAPGGQRR